MLEEVNTLGQRAESIMGSITLDDFMLAPHVCEWFVRKECTLDSFSQWNGKYYCSKHYKKMVLRPYNPDDQTMANINRILEENKVYVSKLTHLFSYQAIHVFEYDYKGQLAMLKIQMANPDGRSMFHGLQTELLITRGTDMRPDVVYHEANRYMCIISKPYDCTLRNYIENGDADVDTIVRQMVSEVNRLHQAMYINCALTPDAFIIVNGRVRLASYISASRYLDDYGNVADNKPHKFVGNAVFSSVNICEFNSGVRNDDAEGLLWIKLWLEHNEVIKSIQESTTMADIIAKKREYLQHINRVPDTLTGAVDWSLVIGISSR